MNQHVLNLGRKIPTPVLSSIRLRHLCRKNDAIPEHVYKCAVINQKKQFMPFNNKNQCVRSARLKKVIIRLISGYVLPQSARDVMKIMLKMLYRMQKYMDQMDYSANDHSSLTFAQRNDALKQAQRKDAVPWIERALAEFQPDLTEQSESDGEEFVKQGGRPESVARCIWKIWCQELERMPRGGIILFFSDCHNQPEVLLTMFRKDSIPQYGFPKGKLRPGETPLQGAIREGAEECGVNESLIRAHIDPNSCIRRNVFSERDKISIEHYYYVVRVPSKNMGFKPQPREIDDLQWHAVNTLPCSSECRVTRSIESAKGLKAGNYFMVLCKEQYGSRSLIDDILDYDCKQLGNQNAAQEYKNKHKICSPKKPTSMIMERSQPC